MKQIDDVYTLVERYLAGEMDANEKAEFELELKENETLREILDVQKDINATIQEKDVNDFSDLLSTIDKELYGAPTKKTDQVVRPLFGIKPQYYLAIAAAVVVIFGVIFFTNRPVSISAEEIYNQNYQLESPGFSVRGGNGQQATLIDSLKEAIQNNFNLKSDEGHKEAIRLYQELIDVVKDSDAKLATKCRYYMAVSYLEIEGEDRTGDAIQIFDKLITEGDKTFSPMSAWTRALVFFRNNDKEAGISAMQEIIQKNDSSIYVKKAKQILTSLGIE